MINTNLSYCLDCGHPFDDHELVDGICSECRMFDKSFNCDCIDTSIDNEGFVVCNECGRDVS